MITIVGITGFKQSFGRRVDASKLLEQNRDVQRQNSEKKVGLINKAFSVSYGAEVGHCTAAY